MPSERAASRQGYAAAAEACDERPQDQYRGAHLAHEIVGGGRRGDVARGELEHLPRPMPRFASLRVCDRDAVLAKQVRHGPDIGEIGQVGEDQRLGGQKAGGHQRQGGVFGAADRNRAGKRRTTANQNAVHNLGSGCRLFLREIGAPLKQAGRCPGGPSRVGSGAAAWRAPAACGGADSRAARGQDACRARHAAGAWRALDRTNRSPAGWKASARTLSITPRRAG